MTDEMTTYVKKSDRQNIKKLENLSFLEKSYFLVFNHISGHNFGYNQYCMREEAVKLSHFFYLDFISIPN